MMITFSAPDGTRLAYHRAGENRPGVAPLVCIPGGAMRASAYLGDLGGLSRRRELALLDLRGTGDSERPADPETYHCDRQVPDVEALRAHLGLDRIDLLSHSAGASLAIQYAAAHPDRVASLTLVTPNCRALGLATTAEDRDEAYALRKDEPWYPEAEQARQRIAADPDSAADEDWDLVGAFSYGRWDEAAQAHHGESESQYNFEAGAIYNSPESFDAAATRAALAALTAPVLVLAGQYDAIPLPRLAPDIAACFPHAQVRVLAGAAHFPWLDDEQGFAAALRELWS